MDVDWSGFYPFKPNPSLEEYKKYNSEIYNKALEFSKTYMQLLHNLGLTDAAEYLLRRLGYLLARHSLAL